MRSWSVLASSFLAVAFLGCGGGGSGDDTGDDDDSPDAGDIDPPASGFQIVTPNIVIQPGEEITYCYYTTIDIDEDVGVKRWSSQMTPGSHHLIVYFTETQDQPDGTITTDCGVTGGGLNFPIWTYSAAQPEAAIAMPEGVGMHVKAQQHLFVQMHYLNTNPTEAIDVHVTINGETFEEGEAYERAAAYVTFNTEIDLDPGETDTVSGTCAVPDGAKFFLLNTHSHRFTTRTQVDDGATMIYESDDWEEPVPRLWNDAPFFEFESGNLTYSCTATNTSGARVQTGDSAATDEMCMAVGYFYPTESWKLCVNSFVIQ
jgi:hypothetical protein